MPTSLLPIAAIRALRLTCRHCGAAVVIPLTAKDAPAQCFNCYAKLPGPEIVRGLVRELHWVQTMCHPPGGPAVDVAAALEHDPVD